VAPDPVSLGPRGILLGGSIPLICAPLVAATRAELLAQAQRLQAACPAPDLVEWRADHLREMSPEALGNVAQELAGVLGADLPLLATVRRASEGGATGWDDAARATGLMAIITSGAAVLIDIELSTPTALRADLMQAARNAGLKLILSAHDLSGTPPDDRLDAWLGELIAGGGAIAKLAVTAVAPNDALRLLHTTARAAARSPVPLATMAMGTVGAITRLEGPRFGSALTYAIVEASSAPGQLPLALVREYWHATGLRPRGS
jgi:3-dehydroquinate dehydratase-1